MPYTMPGPDRAAPHPQQCALSFLLQLAAGPGGTPSEAALVRVMHSEGNDVLVVVEAGVLTLWNMSSRRIGFWVKLRRITSGSTTHLMQN